LDNEEHAKLFNRQAVVVTGELSGENHALHLINAINDVLPLQWSGVGSEKLRQAGVDILYDYRSISLTGLSEIVSKMGQISKAFKTLKKHLRTTLPSLLLLVDFPGFNLRVATMARRLGIPVIYFIPPQVWAWRKSRILRIKRDVALVICILPFEKSLYERQAVPSVYVGHPFMQTVRPLQTRKAFLSSLGLEQSKPVVTIMPGSRENEITKHVPVMLHVIDLLRRELKDMAVLLPVAENIDQCFIETLVRDDPHIKLVQGASHEALASSDIALVASGSATLEAAILDCPTIVMYKVSALSYAAARLLVKIDYISLPNIVAGKEVFPEYIQALKPETIAERVLHVLNNETTRMKQDMEVVRKRLGTFDSYVLARDAVIQFLEQTYGPLLKTSSVS
jgi:lipid-A-disaccharide synthase